MKPKGVELSRFSQLKVIKLTRLVSKKEQFAYLEKRNSHLFILKQVLNFTLDISGGLIYYGLHKGMMKKEEESF